MNEETKMLTEYLDSCDDDEGLAVIAAFRVDGEPLSKARARFTKQGHAYTPARTKQAEAMILAAYLAAADGQVERDTDLAFRVEADFYSGTRQRRDVDNMLKLVLDGLNGYAWPDDVQVLEVSGRKSFVAKAEAHTRVAIYRISGGMNKPTQPCLRCGKPFRTYESWRNNPKGKKYCSVACAGKSPKPRIRTCDHCSKDFEVKSRKSEAMYCSSECRYAHGNIEVECSICGTKFTQHRSWAGERNYCSAPCRRERDRIVHAERRTRHFPGICAICGAGTTRKGYRRCNPCKRAGRPIPA